MFTRIRIVGRGCVGTAIAARLEERGIEIAETGANLVLLCVPDSAIRDVAAGIDTGPWLAQVSGATPLARGDRATVEAHLAAIRSAAPDLELMYRALAQVTTP